jgi:perosamine synthetase
VARRLAIDGGTPALAPALPYGRQAIDEKDVQAVLDALRSDYLTTGPRVEAFEQAFCEFTGCRHAVAVSSGTAALHAAMAALEIGPDDEVIVPTLTFAASANCVLYRGGQPILVDVKPGNLLVSPDAIEEAITPRTRAIVAVDYAGHPCDYDAIGRIADKHGLAVVADSCHSVGGAFRGQSVGTLAGLNCFSFHPVKHLTTGEGGMVTTANDAWADALRRFRNQGISRDHRQRAEAQSWVYEIAELGFNYRLTDVQCALGKSQLKRVPEWVDRRRQIAARYNHALERIDLVDALEVSEDVVHAYHLYVVQLNLHRLSASREQVFRALRAEGVGVNVHYIPVHTFALYRSGAGTVSLPAAEAAYDRILTLPMYPGLTDADVDNVADVVLEVCEAYRR